MRSDKINDEGSEGERELNRLIPSMMWSEDRAGKGLISRNQLTASTFIEFHFSLSFPTFARFPSRLQFVLTSICSSQTRRITLTLFSHPQCPRRSSIHNPPRFPPLSQTIPTHPYSSNITSTSYKLRSAPYAPWHTKRSTPCAFFILPPRGTLASPRALSFLQLIEDPAYYSAKVPTSPDRAPRMQLVVFVPLLPYF